jgi:hypothetical protein
VNRRAFFFPSLFALALLLGVPTRPDENPQESIAAVQNDFQIRVLNTKADEIDMAILKAVSLKIAKLFQEGKLEVMHVKIFAEHPIVKEAMADKTIEFATSDKKTCVIFAPIAQRGKRVIVKRTEQTKDSYTLYSLPDGADVDLGACLRR